jgi:hypothetical protein
MPRRYEYQLTNHQLSTPERVAKFNAELDRLSGEGWSIHTCDTSTHPDVQVLWHRDVTQQLLDADAAAPPPAEPEPGS